WPCASPARTCGGHTLRQCPFSRGQWPTRQQSSAPSQQTSQCASCGANPAASICYQQACPKPPDSAVQPSTARSRPCIRRRDSRTDNALLRPVGPSLTVSTSKTPIFGLFCYVTH